MRRLLTLLLLYKSGYCVGKHVSIERQIEKTKDIYYDVLQTADIGWHEGLNDPTPIISYFTPSRHPRHSYPKRNSHQSI